jgi:hypothetical protein
LFVFNKDMFLQALRKGPHGSRDHVCRSKSAHLDLGIIRRMQAKDAGLCAAAVIRAALRHGKEFACCACAACGPLPLPIEFWCCIHVASCG